MIEEELFHRALEKPTLAEQLAFLDQVCADQPEMRQRVERLLRSHSHEDSFLQAGGTLDQPTIENAGAVVGPYKLLERIGEGGMGTVWMAEQKEPVKRLVAVKLIKAGMDSKQVIARFEAERQALALMDHANIARVLDAGTTGAGRPYFVMDLVRGVPITRYCDEHHFTPRQRLELFVPVCQAVQHAHQKGIIHRDLKPSNVLVALYDGKPVPKVIDFGVAKAAGQSLTDKTLVTGFGNLVGTLEYMSPEQAEVNQLDIDTRSDIYSLGVLLYELLTGSPPFTRKELEKAGMLEMLRVIREQEPSKPSLKLSTAEGLPTLAANRGTEPAKLTKLVRGELDWIVMKALEKDRNRRYETANGFAMDVQRYLADEPVTAGPPSAVYRFRKFVRRNKGPVLAATAIVLLLAAGIIGTTIGMVQAFAAERQAVTERDQKDDARRQAVAEAAVAIEARRQTRQALNTLTDQVVEELLGRQAQLTERSREFLKKVLALQAAFAEAKADDPVGRQSRVEGLFRVGLIRQRLGEFKDAEAAYRDCLALYQQLAVDFPSEAAYRGQAAIIRHNLGHMLEETGHLTEAEAEYRAVLPLQRQLAAEFPNEYRYDVVASLRSLAHLLLAKGRPEEAEALFREGLVLTKQLVAAFPTNPRFRREGAIGYLNLGVALINMGRLPEAETAFRDALALSKQLTADFPNEVNFREEWAIGHSNLGNLLKDTDQPKEAEASFREALTIQKQLAADFPNRPDFRRTLATMQNNLANLLNDNKRPEEAEALLREAVALLKKLASDFPNRADFRDALATSHNSLGNLMLDLDRSKEAETAYRDALTIQEHLATGFPNVPDYRRSAGLTHYNLGSLLSKTGRPKEAETSIGNALAMQKQLVADFPKVPDYQNDLANTLAKLASVHQLRREFAVAVSVFEQARPHRQAALKGNPANAAFRQDFRDDLKVLAENYVALADHARLATTADELAAFAYEPATDTYTAASFLSRCVLLAEKDAQLVEAKRKELAQNYADRAMTMLRRAVARGYKDVAHMKKDADLDALRGREDYKKLIAELEARQKK
jgi:serine/threonine protein kinase/tetratricopeptide (TPR) repeat protein